MMPEPLVYFIENAAGHVKVGVAKDVSARMRSLQCASSTPLCLLGTAPGGYALERAIHMRWAAHRLMGEWFVKAPTVAAHIAELCAGNAAFPTDDRNAVTAFRSKMRWSQQRAAAELGVAQTTVCRWESGISPIPQYVCMLLAILTEAPPEKAAA